VSKITTLCVGCGFATYDGELLERGEKKQVGCAVNRIKAFEEANTEIELMPDNTFKIHRYCNMARHPKWVEKHGVNSVDVAFDECAVKIDIVIPFLSGMKLDDLYVTLNNVKQTEKVNRVSIEWYNKECSSVSMKEVLLFCKDELKSRFIIRNYKSEVSDVQILELINQAVSKLDGQYYTILMPGMIVLPDIFSLLNHAINIKLDQIILVKSTLGRPAIVHRLAHVKLGGNTREKTIYDVLQKYAAENGYENTIKTWDQLCSYRK
jgi:hypothetical protein